MNIHYYTRKFDLDQETKNYIEEKLKLVKKHFEQVIDVHVDLSTNDAHKKDEIYRVEINVHVPKQILRAVERASNKWTAIDEVINKLLREVRKYKTKIDNRNRHRRYLRKIGEFFGR
ncbi:MAG: ribosome-associated translation inhibitor RaiA [Patescibacteria group bacterium]|jgi:putative sigma-54 modulation protein|nr:ribosome-associated translation inhibitor RaiA [Patescibacteria group bacterium]